MNGRTLARKRLDDLVYIYAPYAQLFRGRAYYRN